MLADRMVEKIIDQLRYRKDFQRYICIGVFLTFLMFLLYLLNWFPPPTSGFGAASDKKLPLSASCSALDYRHVMRQHEFCVYNPKYPLSSPLRSYEGISYKIGVIADLDEERSKVVGKEYTWQSYYKTGLLERKSGGTYAVTWQDRQVLLTRLNEKGRGLELSELCVFNKKLYSVDDRTGIVYQITRGKAIPWVILMDGDGNTEKGFKSEWMTVKDGVLYVGGLGKEWTTKSGEFLNYNPLFVKSIDALGGVVHHNWTDAYLRIRAAVGIKFPGYMVHEAVMWSSVHKRWYFLPRRMSSQKYDDASDERRGTNVLISCDKHFNNVNVVYVGKVEPTHGFSSFRFIPGTKQTHIVALKTQEVEGNISTYIMVFDTKGNVIMPEKFIASEKFEGIEFI